ncbi:MAG: oligosaccharide flippase family protein [Bacteroidota bacterium]
MLSKLKSLASDTLVYGISTIVGRFLTFMLTPIYSNYISGDEYGDVVYIFSIIAFFNILNSFGMDSAFFRFYKKDNPEDIKKVFTKSYLVITVVSGILSGLAIIFAEQIAPKITSLPNGVTLIPLAAIIPFLDAVMIIPYSYLRMSRHAKRFAYTKFSLIIIAVFFNFLLVVKYKMGGEGVFYAQLAANIAGALIFIPMIIKNLTFKFDKALFIDMLKFGIPTLPATLSAMILQVADRPILKLLTDSHSVAMYTINYRLGIPMLLLVSVFEYAWKPFYLSHYEEPDSKKLFARVLTYFTLISAAVFLITGFFIQYIVMMPFIGGKFINPAYWSGMGIIPIILGGYYFNGMYNNFAAGFHIEKKTQYLPIAIGAAALANILLNFILIPVFGYWGAAWATLGAYFISAVLLYLFQRKIYPNIFEWKRIAIIFITTIIIFTATSYFTSNMEMKPAFIIRIASLFLFIIILWSAGFFKPEEIKALKRIFRIKQ